MASVNADLWDNYDGRGFAAEYSKYSVRASKDENGNNIKATYATKEDLNAALGDIESRLAAL